MMKSITPTIEDTDLDNFNLYDSSQFSASHVGVQQVKIDNAGLSIKSNLLEEFNFVSDSESSLLMLPGFFIMTNHPGKQRLIKAIEELQYRQDELKQDFSQAIIHLAQSIRY